MRFSLRWLFGVITLAGIASTDCRVDGSRTRTSRVNAWWSTLDLPQPLPTGFRTHTRNTPGQPLFRRGGRAAGQGGTVALHVNALPLCGRLKRRRWESNPLQTALQAVAVPSGSSVRFI